MGMNRSRNKYRNNSGDRSNGEYCNQDGHT